MKKEILKLFTTTYKIPLSACALNYLSTKFTSYSSLEVFIEQNIDFLRTKKPLKKEDIIICESQVKNPLYTFKILKYTESNLMERYNFFKNKITANIIGILIIENNKYFLENEDNTIELNLNINQNIYLQNDIFIGCNGYYENKMFVVKEIILPRLENRGNNNKLQNKEVKIAILSVKNKEKINNINVDIKIILNDRSNDNFYSNDLMKNPGNKDSMVNENIIYLSSLQLKNLPYKNSMVLNFNSCEIFVSLDTFKPKGIFFGENIYNSYVKTILSQYITNTNIQSPVLEYVPDIFIVQSKSSFVTKIENKIFVSMAEEENKYVEINTLDKIIEIKEFTL